MAINFVGTSEIAVMGNVTKQAVTNWRIRYDSFPKPIQTLQSGPVWDREAVARWIKDFKGETTHVLSFINLKGGVGKTTVAVAVAEILSHEGRKRVLVVDLDPQTNASVTLISEEKWAEMDREGRTIAQLFADRLNENEAPRFDVERAIAQGVSTINGGIARLDLLPSSIRLIDIQDRIPMIALSGNFTVNPQEILRSALQPILDRYDYVIIDCPPSLGTVTKNGLRISTGYVIPTKPDIVSTWGLYQIVDNIHRFAGDINRSIPPLGIVATMVMPNNNLHPRVIEDLRSNRLGRFGESGALPQPPLFLHSIRNAIAVARGADVEMDISTLKGKYGPAYDDFKGLAREIKEICEKKKPS